MYMPVHEDFYRRLLLNIFNEHFSKPSGPWICFVEAVVSVCVKSFCVSFLCSVVHYAHDCTCTCTCIHSPTTLCTCTSMPMRVHVHV